MSDGLIRVLTHDEAHHPHNGCAWWAQAEGNCDAVPLLRLATPHGHLDYCRDHIDYALASLPEGWIASWCYREPVPVGDTDDIPF